MASDIPISQSVRTSRSSSSSSNGYETPSYYSAITTGDDYDSDGSNFAHLTPMTLSNTISAELAGAIPLIDKFQVEGFLRAMQKQINSGGKRSFFSKRSLGPQDRDKLTFEDMLCFQRDPIPTSLLKINGDLVSWAVKLFQTILKYTGIDSYDKANQIGLEERIELVGKLYEQAWEHSELRDEIFAQISKQTRNCPDRQHLIRAWELMYLCASCMPPSKDIGEYLSEYIHDIAHNVNTDPDVQVFAMNTLNALKCSMKAGPRHTIPGREEIEALLIGKKLTTIVFFLDETFEEIAYDMATTVANAVEELAGIIKLSAYSSFSLFECRKVVTASKSPEPGNEEYIGLDDNKYIGDLLAEFKSVKDRSKGEILQCKLIFRKMLFRESDEPIADPMFVRLSYVQLQHDYIFGNYPVGKDDAAQLSALQILVETGYVVKPESCTDWTLLLERFLPRQIAITRSKREWELDILNRYRSMENLTKEDARHQFLRILRMLPYGFSVFFSVRKIDDPIGLLTERIILGINKRGVHFFRPVPKEYLHSVDLRDIVQFGSSDIVLVFIIRLADVLHIFQFETEQCKEICVALQTHINEESQNNAKQAGSAAKTMVEEKKRLEDAELARLRKENKDCKLEISKLNQELGVTRDTYEKRCVELERHATEIKSELEKKMMDLENLLTGSRKKVKELEHFTESKFLRWKKKERGYKNFMDFQCGSLKELRMGSESIKQEVIRTQQIYEEEINQFGMKIQCLVDAAKNYHIVLTENRKFYNEVQDLKGNIRVYCRIRPFLKGQNQKHTTIEYIGDNGELVVTNPSKIVEESHRLFKFNKVFSPAATQEEVFIDTQPLIRSVLDGYNVCIFAYGPTGSGKTYTMTGPNASSPEDWGVNYRALNDLFHLSQIRRSSFEYEIGVQMVEIYNEQVLDLLSTNSTQRRLGIWNSTQPDGSVPDDNMHPVTSTADILELMNVGLMNRAVGATALNERSSRSHSVLTVHVRGTDLETNGILRGNLHLVDLAGSEQVNLSKATGDRLREAQHINKSLSALGDVIFALAQKSQHVPYGNSKLTQVLQSSLGGQAKTLMFVQLNPDVESFSETISTLKFAERVSGVKLGAARSNKEGRGVRELMEKVTNLKDGMTKKDEEMARLRVGKTSTSGEKSLNLGPKAASDIDNCSEFSDKQSEARQ